MVSIILTWPDGGWGQENGGQKNARWTPNRLPQPIFLSQMFLSEARRVEWWHGSWVDVPAPFQSTSRIAREGRLAGAGAGAGPGDAAADGLCVRRGRA